MRPQRASERTIGRRCSSPASASPTIDVREPQRGARVSSGTAGRDDRAPPAAASSDLLARRGRSPRRSPPVSNRDPTTDAIESTCWAPEPSSSLTRRRTTACTPGGTDRTCDASPSPMRLDHLADEERVAIRTGVDRAARSWPARRASRRRLASDDATEHDVGDALPRELGHARDQVRARRQLRAVATVGDQQSRTCARSSAARCVSTRSVSMSAHWRSSTTRTCGRVDALRRRARDLLRVMRTGSAARSHPNRAGRAGSAARTAAPRRPRDTGPTRPRCPARSSPPVSSSTSAVLPMPDGPVTVTTPPRRSPSRAARRWSAGELVVAPEETGHGFRRPPAGARALATGRGCGVRAPTRSAADVESGGVGEGGPGAIDDPQRVGLAARCDTARAPPRRPFRSRSGKAERCGSRS